MTDSAIFPGSDLWLNPHQGEPLPPPAGVSPAASAGAAARLARFAPLLARIFPPLAPAGGQVESRLLPVPGMQRALALPPSAGRLWVKADHELPVVGSIKARGGMHEVLLVAERIATEHGLLPAGGDTARLAEPPARAVFAQHRIAVGSTGNLGLSIGLTAAALGFSVSVYMSTDAKDWKKRLLREHGAEVVEIAGDYRLAVAAGRESAAADASCHFVDDEDSLPLLLGYSSAAPYLARQLAAAGVAVDAAHPLFVYLPCGVGGAPAGLLYGLRQQFGAHVHGFFAEPVQSACFRLQMQAAPGEHPTVYDAGLTNCTEADGLAVPSASLLAAAVAAPMLAGGITVTDETLAAQVYALERTQGLAIEASAAAGFGGPALLLGSEAGREYLARHDLAAALPQATHLAWLTGGSLMPRVNYDALHARGATAWATLGRSPLGKRALPTA